MDLLKVCHELMCLLETAHDLVQHVPRDHHDELYPLLEAAHSIIQDKIKPVVDAQ